MDHGGWAGRLVSQGLGWADLLRRQQGRWLEALGYGPVETGWRTVVEAPGLRLRHYPGRGRGPALLIVPAPVKRAYIWDLHPDRSVVRQAMAAGLRVFLLEWTGPVAGWGLADYADTAIGAALDAVAREAGPAPVALAGHSLGGSFAALFAAAHPGRPRALILVEAPLRFDAGAGVFAAAVSAIPRGVLEASRGWPDAPGSLLDLGSAALAPATFILEPWSDAWLSAADPANCDLHLRVRRWTLDEFAMPGSLIADLLGELYQADGFFRGRLRLSGRLLRPEDIAAPVFAVVNPGSPILPPSALLPVLRRIRSPVRRVYRYRGDRGAVLQHVGALVGDSAHRLLWPRLFRDLRDQIG